MSFEHFVREGMFVRRSGAIDGAREWVVWIHGLGESGLGFEEVVKLPILAPYCHLIPDLASYGRSAWSKEPLTLTEQADRLASWLTSLGRPVVLAGHSMGGVIATLLGERHPQKLRAMLNIDGNQSFGDCAFSRRAEPSTLEQFLRDGFARMLDIVWKGGGESRPLRGYYASMRFCDPRAFHLNSRELVQLSREERLARRMKALSLPMLYVAGSPGGAAPRSHELLHEAGVPVATVEPSGHWPFIDQPEKFANLVARFLEDLPQPT